MSYFIMHRRGVCKPRKATSNQCKVEGYQTYKYNIIMVFPSDITLDAKNFIMDHQEIDHLVQNTYIRGSCEQMHLKIASRLVQFFSHREIDIRAFKIRLRGDSSDSAYMEYVHTTVGDNRAISLLTP